MSTAEEKYPECEKLRKVSEKSQELGFFLEWLMGKYTLGKWHNGIDTLLPTSTTIESILADYFEIDMVKVNEERAQILKELRSVK